MKSILTLILTTFSFFLMNFALAQSDGFFTKSSPLPYWRHSYDALVSPNNTIYSVGGWDSNDAITSAFESLDTGMSWSAKMDMVNAAAMAVCFSNDSTSYVVGNDGLAMKSVDGGNYYTSMTISGNAGLRNFQDVFFTDSNNGIIVGGNEANDSIQTILRTTNGGSTWNVISDNLGYYLRAVHFSSANVGYIVGDDGTILKTTDAGANWVSQTPPGNTSVRQFHSVFFIDDDTGWIVGGHPDNDSIQTIISTSDGGVNWTLVQDKLGSMLLDVWMRSTSLGFAVGDDGVILETSDGGSNWVEVNLVDTVNDNEPLTSVYFSDEHHGVFGGKVGKILWYEDTTVVYPDAPIIVSVEQAELVVIQSVLEEVNLSGVVNGQGVYTEVFFDIGMDSSNTSAYPTNPSSISDSMNHSVLVSLDNFQSNQLYFYRLRAENSAGVTTSKFYQFHTNFEAIPNWSFEHWDTVNTEIINEWTNFGNVTKVSSFNGSSAVRLQGEGTDTPGVILHGDAGNNGISGGIPFTDRPDSLVAYFDYDIASGDSAFILLMLKENGNMVANDMYFIDGSSGGSYQRMAFAINYINSDTPDSLILAMGSTNVFAGTFNTASVLKVDEVEFINSSSNVPNADMEDWTMTTIIKPQSWYGVEDLDGDGGTTLHRSMDAQHGIYAMKMQNDSSNSSSEVFMYSGSHHDGNHPDFEVFAKHRTFNGYYQFDPSSNNDSLQIRIHLFKNGQLMGYGDYLETGQKSSWEPFTINIDYFQNQVPDSARIEVLIMNDGNVGMESMAMLDNFSFDGFISDELIDNIPTVYTPTGEIDLFPNPASGEVWIKAHFSNNEQANIQVYTLSGKLIRSFNSISFLKGETTIPIQLDGMTSGIYVVMIQTSNHIISKKLVIY